MKWKSWLCFACFGVLACRSPEAGGHRTDRSPEPHDGGMSDAGQSDGSIADGGAGCAALDCDPQATCAESDVGAACVCRTGFSGDGTTCTDVDECEASDDDCDGDAHCINRQGGFGCLCMDGFVGDGRECDDLNQCIDPALDTCDPNAQCSDTSDGFDCACDASFSGDGFGCADVDECDDALLFECPAHADCVNTFGSYRCECAATYVGDGTADCPWLCEIALADTNVCAANGRCRIVDDAGICDACAPGYTGDGMTCTPIVAVCATCDASGVDDIADTVCVSDACVCAPGFTGDPMVSCTDIDECATNNGNCGTNTDCLNLDGGYFCDCQAGYEENGSGVCVDIDECASTPKPCHPNATCTNRTPTQNPAGFECTCKAGYSGDGSVCRDIDECAEDEDNCLDDGTARCVNTDGSFTCPCKRGYSGDGVTECENIDECEDDELNGCDENAVCTDRIPTENPLGYDCACKSGLGGDGTTCDDIDECANAALNDCASHASCVNEVGGYHCECKAPFTGDDPSHCYCDLSGYWAMRQDVDTCWCDRTALAGSVTVVSAGTVEATVWELHEYEYDGETIRVRKSGCGGDNTPDLISPFFGTPGSGGETYSSYVPDAAFDQLGLQRGIDIPEPGLVPGSIFMTPQEAAVVGIDLGSDPESAAWPTSRNSVHAVGGAAPAWVDVEDDGVPGLTVWPRVPSTRTDASTSGDVTYYSYLPVDFTSEPTTVTQRAGCVSLATRVITRLEADVETCERIVGDVINLRTDGRVNTCSRVPMADWENDVACSEADWDDAESCSSGDITRLDDQDQSQTSVATFELIKIGGPDDEIDCADVRDTLPALVRSSPSPLDCDCP